MKNKLLYWIPTGLLVAAMVASATAYFSDIEGTKVAFAELGYPAYTLYFNAIAKILGGIALVFPVGRILKEWAYAGYLFILALAGQALFVRMPDMAPVILVFVVVWAFSYWQFRKQQS